MASGLGLPARGERDPWTATTFGTGEVIAAASRSGALSVLVAAGGSATVASSAAELEAAGERLGAALRDSA